MRYLFELFIIPIIKFLLVLAIISFGMYALFSVSSYLTHLLPITADYQTLAAIIGMVLIGLSVIFAYMVRIIRDNSLTRSEKWNKILGL